MKYWLTSVRVIKRNKDSILAATKKLSDDKDYGKVATIALKLLPTDISKRAIKGFRFYGWTSEDGTLSMFTPLMPKWGQVESWAGYL